jgi:diacylglycerol kinase
MSAKRFFQSFRDAYEGIRFAFEHESNFRFQLFAALVVLFFTAWLPLRGSELLLVLVMVFMVLVVELLNTAIERFIDLLKPRLHHYAKTVKDVMAGAVFLTSLAALIVGIIIFTPYVVRLFK